MELSTRPKYLRLYCSGEGWENFVEEYGAAFVEFEITQVQAFDPNQPGYENEFTTSNKMGTDTYTTRGLSYLVIQHKANTKRRKHLHQEIDNLKEQ
eukprot:2087321-Rhodomonas_salina.1